MTHHIASMKRIKQFINLDPCETVKSKEETWKTDKTSGIRQPIQEGSFENSSSSVYYVHVCVTVKKGGIFWFVFHNFIPELILNHIFHGLGNITKIKEVNLDSFCQSYALKKCQESKITPILIWKKNKFNVSYYLTLLFFTCKYIP